MKYLITTTGWRLIHSITMNSVIKGLKKRVVYLTAKKFSILCLFLLSSAYSLAQQGFTIRQLPSGNYKITSNSDPLKTWTVYKQVDGTLKYVNDNNVLDSYTTRLNVDGSSTTYSDSNILNSFTTRQNVDGSYTTYSDSDILNSSTTRQNVDGSYTISNTRVNRLPDVTPNYGLPPVTLPKDPNDGGAYQNPQNYAPNYSAIYDAYSNAFNQINSMMRSRSRASSNGSHRTPVPMSKREGNTGGGVGIGYSGGLIIYTLEGFLNSISLGGKLTWMPENEDDWGDGIRDPTYEVFGTMGIKVHKNLYLKGGLGFTEYLTDFDENKDNYYLSIESEYESATLYGVQGFFKAGPVALAPEVFMTSTNGLSFSFSIIF